MPHTIYNTDKNRKATPNELAKRTIIDKLESLVAIQECWGLEKLTDEEAQEVLNFYAQHLRAIKRKLNPNNTYFEWR